MRIDKLDIDVTFGVLGALLGLLLGPLDGLLIALICFMVLDYITGILAAVIGHRLNSEIGFIGIIKKAVMLCVVMVGHIVDSRIIQSGSVARTAVILFYLSNEGISILENSAKIGVPFPQKLIKILEQINKSDS